MEGAALLLGGQGAAGEAACHGVDGRLADHRLGEGGVAFVVTREAAVRGQPGEGALHRPAAREDGEASAARGLADEVDGGAQDLLGPVDETAGEAAVSEHMPHRGGKVQAQQSALAPSRSATLAVQTMTTSSRPNVSVTMNRLRPLTFLPAS